MCTRRSVDAMREGTGEGERKRAREGERARERGRENAQRMGDGARARRYKFSRVFFSGVFVGLPPVCLPASSPSFTLSLLCTSVYRSVSIRAGPVAAAVTVEEVVDAAGKRVERITSCASVSQLDGSSGRSKGRATDDASVCSLTTRSSSRTVASGSASGGDETHRRGKNAIMRCTGACRHTALKVGIRRQDVPEDAQQLPLARTRVGQQSPGIHAGPGAVAAHRRERAVRDGVRARLALQRLRAVDKREALGVSGCCRALLTSRASRAVPL